MLSNTLLKQSVLQIGKAVLNLLACSILLGLASCQAPLISKGILGPTTQASGTGNDPPGDKPEFLLVFVPLGWESDRSTFEREAHRQANFLIRESGIESYFQVQVVLLDDGPQELFSGTDGLLQQVNEFGQQLAAGDRYIGLSDSDLDDEWIKGLRGGTLGPGSLAVVVEAGNETLLAHELGHTFGLCDEYNYSDWSLQDRTYPSGCPNPYPPLCPRLVTQEIICIGQNTDDGRFSLMGPAGLDGDYGYNSASLNYLDRHFKQLTKREK